MSNFRRNCILRLLLGCLSLKLYICMVFTNTLTIWHYKLPHREVSIHTVSKPSIWIITNCTPPWRCMVLYLLYMDMGSYNLFFVSVCLKCKFRFNSTSGLFLHNAAELWVEITNNEVGADAFFMADSGALDLFIFLGPSPVDVVRQYTSLTGVAHLPPVCFKLSPFSCLSGFSRFGPSGTTSAVGATPTNKTSRPS